MSTDIHPLRGRSPTALDDSLAAWLGWFSSAPLPDDMASLVEQLEAAYVRSKVEAAQIQVR